jgi:hypothetical protein
MRLGPALGAPAAPALIIAVWARLAAPALVIMPWANGAGAAGMTAEPIAVMQGLDKITARVSRFDVPVGKAANFFTLSIVVRECQRSAPEDRPENVAFVEIYENRPGEEKTRLFSGWMFSSSPALSALEHPVYDLNLLECKGPGGAAPPPPSAPSTPKPPAPGRSRGNTAR